MTQPLVKVTPDLILSGIHPSLDPLSVPFWHDGQNVVFRKLGVTKAPGWVNELTLTEDIYEIAQAFVEGNDRAYLGGLKRVSYYQAGTGLVNIFQFQSNGNIRLEPWGTWLLMANGVNPVKLWKNEEVVDITNIPFTFAKLIKRFNVHMMAANTSEGESFLHWCAASDVEDWAPTRANSAGDFNVRDADGEITALTSIGRQIGVYSAQRLVTGAYTGQPFIFSFNDRPLEGVGAVGANSVVEVGAKNIGMSRQGVFATDGYDFQYVDEPSVQQWLQDTVDWSQPERIIAYRNDLLTQVIWNFPTVDGGWSGIPYSYARNTFGGRLTGKFTATSEQFVFPTPLAVVDKKLVFLNTGFNAGDSALPSLVRSKPLDAGEGSVWKTFDYLRVTGQWTGGKVRLGAMENPNDITSIEWFVDEAMALEHFFDRDTPFIVVEFSTSLLDENFNLSGLFLGGEPSGYQV